MGYYSNKVNQAYSSLNSIVGNVTEIIQKKQSVDIAYQLEEDKVRYQRFLNAAQQDPAEFETIKTEFEKFAADHPGQAANQFSLPGARRIYEQQSRQLANGYAQQFTTIQTNHMVRDGRAKEKALLDDLVKKAPYESGAFNEFLADLIEKARGSQFYTKAESELMADQYAEIARNNAVMAGAQSVFHGIDGNYSERASAARAWLSSPEGAQALGPMSSESFEKMNSMVNSWESDARTKQNWADQEYDKSLNESIWGFVKSGNVVSAKNAWLNGNFRNEDENKYWDNYFRILEKDLKVPGDRAVQANAAKQDVYEVQRGVEEGFLTTEQGVDIMRSRVENYGMNEAVGEIYRDAEEYFSKPELSENEAYKTGQNYFKNLIDDLDLKEENPALLSFIEADLKNFASDPKNAEIQTEEEYRKRIDALLLEPVIKKLNDNISSGFGDSMGVNTSEEFTQQFDESFRALFKVDAEGNYDTEYYKDWVAAWGYEEKAGGRYQNIDDFLRTYLDDFGTAAKRDFDGNPMIHIDKATKRPILEQEGERFILQVVTSQEENRLKDLGVRDVKRNDEAWYRWDAEEGMYVYFQQVGN